MNVQRLFRLVSICVLFVCPADARGAEADQDGSSAIERAMDVMDVREGMIVGEAGAGDGFWAVKMSRRVGERGEVYANEISRGALRRIQERCHREGITNVTPVFGSVADARFPRNDLDRVYMRHVLHCMRTPERWLTNIRRYLKEDGLLVIIEADPDVVGYGWDYLIKKDAVLKMAHEAGLELVRIEEILLPDDYIYIFRVDPDAVPESAGLAEAITIFFLDHQVAILLVAVVVVGMMVAYRRWRGRRIHEHVP